jgi:excisionase family DNA binding protein
MDQQLFTIPQTAELLELGRSQVYKLVAAGQIETVPVGKSRRVPAEAVHDFVRRLRNQRILADIS